MFATNLNAAQGYGRVVLATNLDGSDGDLQFIPMYATFDGHGLAAG
jgi:hypothetical protein